MRIRSILTAIILATACKASTAASEDSTTQTRAEPAQAATPTRVEQRTIDPSIDTVSATTDAANAALARLPKCARSMASGTLQIRSTFCTEKFCKAECCNACGFEGVFTGVTEAPLPLSAEQLTALLMKDATPGKDCTVAAWAAAVQGKPLGLILNEAGQPSAMCVTPPASSRKPTIEREDIVAAIESLPACVPAKMQGYQFGTLDLSSTICTRMACKTACCNGCSWRATFTNEKGGLQELAADSLKRFLVNGDAAPAKDCEIELWSTVLKDFQFGIALPPSGDVKASGPVAQGLCLKGALK